MLSRLFDTVRIDITVFLPSTISLLPRAHLVCSFAAAYGFSGPPSLVLHMYSGRLASQMACRTLSDIVYGGVPLMGVLAMGAAFCCRPAWIELSGLSLHGHGNNHID